MALIACPECGQNISSEASLCLHCGVTIDPRRTKVDYVTGETLGLRPRPAAYAARRPRRYPTLLGVGLMVSGAVLTIVGSVMPWAQVGSESISGLDSDGRFTLVIGFLMVTLGVASRTSPSRFPRSLVMIGAVLVILIGVIDINRLSDGISEAGPGVRVVFLGGIVALVGSFLRDR